MSDVLTDKIRDVFASKVLEFFADKTKDELIEIITKDDLKKILFKTMKKFTESDYYKQEFGNSYKFIDDGGKYIKDNIQNDKINPSLTIDELNHNLLNLIDVYFKSDNDKSFLLNQIVLKYRTNASLKITLYDLLIQQQDCYKQISEQLDINTKVLTEINNQHEESDLFNKYIFDESIRGELRSILSQISNRYLYFVMKESPTYVGDESGDIKAVKTKICNVQKNMNSLVNNDFNKTPIKTLVPNMETILQCFNNNKLITSDIPYSRYCEYDFKGYIIKEIDNILEKYKTYLPHEFIKLLFDLKNQLNNVIFITGLQYGIDISKFTVVNPDSMIECFRNALNTIGNIIVKLIEFVE